MLPLIRLVGFLVTCTEVSIADISDGLGNEATTVAENMDGLALVARVPSPTNISLIMYHLSRGVEGFDPKAS
jgi:hypothetical protein